MILHAWKPIDVDTHTSPLPVLAWPSDGKGKHVPIRFSVDRGLGVGGSLTLEFFDTARKG